jgi:hypothetical protein
MCVYSVDAIQMKKQDRSGKITVKILERMSRCLSLLFLKRGKGGAPVNIPLGGLTRVSWCELKTLDLEVRRMSKSGI